jgi:phosphocarrier protein HPr
MYSVHATVKNKIGLHARPATKVAKKAASFSSDVWLRKSDSDNQSNAKSITAILRLGAVEGTDLTITADGSDEEQVCKELKVLIEEGLDG